eukprot:gnl/TRDRNA2_/TRDRNA2_35607_c0_seq1.p1 gnl/TRDRNA2_/TRDRNA2_35607_c0~~gnl/TRDRNA2_/TRDRNA2_35607_c0_seq1.p1  ORF type:complete len:211 (-),score=35.55 gnl/TRDRNA2_/TRDRNA2_35607_c0_seq1:84-716(-)
MPLLPIFSSSEDSSQGPEVSLAAKARPWFLALVALQIVAVVLRCWLGDVHGSLFMIVVVLVGVFALVADDTLDIPYCELYGVLAFISGVLDMSTGSDMLGKHRPNHHHPQILDTKHHALWLPALLFVSSVLQLSSAFLCYVVCKEADEIEEQAQEALLTGPVLATREEARIYGAALGYTQRQRLDEHDTGPKVPSGVPEAFKGRSHKLPP